MNGSVSTVLGPIPADELGVIAIHDRLLSVLPGAQFGYDITLDRADLFATLTAALTAFRAAGGGTVVDAAGLDHGRDLALYEALSRSTGVHIIASTGMGPEEMLGGYFLTPQTNPSTPWPAERFAALFGAELSEGMAVPRVERRAPAGLICTAVTATGATATDESLLRGSAAAALAGGVPVSVRAGADPTTVLDVLVGAGLPADRVLIADSGEHALAVAERGAHVVFDRFGRGDDADMLAQIAALVAAGHAARILLSAGAIGVAAGQPGSDVPFEYILTHVVPALRECGVADTTIQQILTENPRNLLQAR